MCPVKSVTYVPGCTSGARAPTLATDVGGLVPQFVTEDQHAAARTRLNGIRAMATTQSRRMAASSDS